MSEAEMNAEVAAVSARAAPARRLTMRAMRFLQEGTRYFVASLMALAIDYGLLVALTDVARLYYLASSAISYSLGVAVHYGLCVKFVFRDRPVTDRRKEFAGFFAVGLFGLGVTQLMLWLCVSRFGLDYRAAKVATTAMSFTLNFVVRKVLLFTRQAPAR